MRGTTRRRLVGWVLGALGVASVAHGAELDVLVRQRDGRPVPGITVVAFAATPSRDRPARAPRRATRRAVTDRSGRLRLADLPEGTYELRVPGAFTHGLVPPADNPDAPPPLVTVRSAEQRTVPIELWRGVSVRVRVAYSGWDEATFTARFTHVVSGETRTTNLDDRRPEVSRLLPAGLWAVSVEARSGFVLESLIRDGSERTGNQVMLDLRAEPFATDLVFLYRVDARLEGTVTVAGPTPGLRLQAELLEAGAWLADVQVRGVPGIELVVRRPDPRDGRFHLPLPAGRWRVRPIATVPITSEPEARTVELGPGTFDTVHFDVTPEQAADALVVHVADPSRSDLEGAIVELYHDGELLETATTGVVGSARFFGLVPGAIYRVVAGATRTLEAAAELRFDPAAARTVPPDGGVGPWTGSRLRLQPPEGAGFDIEAFDLEGHDLPGVSIDIERVAGTAEDGTAAEQGDDLPPIELQSAAYRQSKLARRVLTDRRGRARVAGFYDGVYRLRARLARGEIALGRMLLSAGGADPVDDLQVELTSDEITPIEVLLVPAARISTTLQCDDGGPLPEHADVRVFRTIRTEGGVVLAAHDERPVLQLDRRGVDEIGRLVVGPLDAGSFELALRPAGFTRWTWAFETTERAQALPIPVAPSDVRSGRELELGAFVIQCEPAVDLAFEVEGGLAPLSEELTVSARLFDRERAVQSSNVEPSTSDSGAPIELRRPSLRFDGDVLQLRGIRPGKTRLVVEITHPRLLPHGAAQRVWELELERGGYLREVVTLPLGDAR